MKFNFLIRHKWITVAVFIIFCLNHEYDSLIFKSLRKNGKQFTAVLAKILDFLRKKSRIVKCINTQIPNYTWSSPKVKPNAGFFILSAEANLNFSFFFSCQIHFSTLEYYLHLFSIILFTQIYPYCNSIWSYLLLLLANF